MHILCTECSEDLAEVYPVYEAVRNAACKIALQKSKISVENISMRPDVIPDLLPVFSLLGLNKHCCRIHIIGGCSAP